MAKVSDNAICVGTRYPAWVPYSTPHKHDNYLYCGDRIEFLTTTTATLQNKVEHSDCRDKVFPFDIETRVADPDTERHYLGKPDRGLH
jgi:hypothetical protein